MGTSCLASMLSISDPLQILYVRYHQIKDMLYSKNSMLELKNEVNAEICRLMRDSLTNVCDNPPLRFYYIMKVESGLIEYFMD